MRKFGRKIEGRREFGRPRNRWEDNFGIYLKYMVRVVQCLYIAQISDLSWVSVGLVAEICDSIN